MSSDHRRLLFYSDWVPLTLVLLFVSLAFGCMAALIPFLLEAGDRTLAVWAVCFVVAFFAMLCAAGWGWYGLRDYWLMVTYIDTGCSSMQDVQGADAVPTTPSAGER